ncbi:type I-G CRISPR-associated helicase/endonuclease Cas3g [Roseospira visakhapatnamensis]|uniref:CRISPR-associated endonuclease/helicase Cas3 n=1 Tax=Roseospira visakhapatnamensis TaxID=390880 RepID=A0A7W6REP7_9PROT|nr:type I-U CRISPR-associated helicase/endonuclease Cas3 [Roseospira visakhapatnamensis]MBB4266686.1 CRISPR-associated endonuclease/helicase Cas3 [Roseospira visakhapatnamensis]
MTQLHASDFPAFFEGVHGFRPFLWQKRFAREVFKTGLPDVIRVPTACGKTSVLDVALFRLALDADRPPANRQAPRRLCFVIDRRLVVDEVSEHARAIQAALEKNANPITAAVAARLKTLSADGETPLRIVRLRGGVYRDDGWAADPLTPTILISTVDQIGSRLLFRGYGVSRRSRPLQAGLLAFDTHLILDEAHLSDAFAETVGAIRRFKDWAEKPPLPASRGLGLTRMSATLADRSDPAEKLFELTQAEREDENLKNRLKAAKHAKLVKIEGVKKSPDRFRDSLVNQAKALAGFKKKKNEPSEVGIPRVIGVVVNRVATARQVFEALRSASAGEPERDAILLTGRIRPSDRDRLLKDWLPWIKANREQDPQRPLFVVATQTVEVGANLDFDALVTEAAALDALRQRFGRLDRLGKRHAQHLPSPAVVVIRSDQTSDTYDDPIYGKALSATWKDLQSISERKVVDFGVNALDQAITKQEIDINAMVAPARDAPVLFPAHLNAWVQTDPVPEPDPDVAPFLHGVADRPADVQVVWRADLTEANADHWGRIVTLMPPRTREAMPVPLSEVRAWLRGNPTGAVADVEGVSQAPSERSDRESQRVLRWRGKDDARFVGAEDLRPGDTIVVPATYGGADAFGWTPGTHKPVPDIAEACLLDAIVTTPAHVVRRPWLRWRLHPALLPNTDEVTKAALTARLERALNTVRSGAVDATDRRRLALELLDVIAGAHSGAEQAAVMALREAGTSLRVTPYTDGRDPDGRGLMVSAPATRDLVEALNSAGRSETDETEVEEPEADGPSVFPGGQSVTLDDHTKAVSGQARAFAEKAGLDTPFTEALALAGRWHDAGKADPRFQAWLYDSEINAFAAMSRGELLAKSGQDSADWQSSERFGYPKGARHEFVSVRLFEDAGLAGGEVGDLARLLIGTHHGHGRAFPPVVDDPSPIRVRVTVDGKTVEACSSHGLHHLDSDWIDLFWRLVRRHGWWGLAYLEALLVTADRTVSAREQRPTDPNSEPDAEEPADP